MKDPIASRRWVRIAVAYLMIVPILLVLVVQAVTAITN